MMPSKMLLRFLSLILWISSLASGATVERSYESRIEVEANRLKIKPIRPARENDPRVLLVDTSVFDSATKPQICTDHETHYCLHWKDEGDFKIKRINDNCETHEMNAVSNKPLSVTFPLDGVHLYGGTEMMYQRWPTQKAPLTNAPYVTDETNAQNVFEKYWLDSTGRYVFVDKSVPLFVTQNETVLTLTAHIRLPYLRPTNATTLRYRYCNFENTKLAHLDAIANVFQKPTRTPNRKVIEYPIWSTWATYKTNISEKTVYDFAQTIQQFGFRGSVLEIDDLWETCYGSLTVDTKRFPDMKRLVQDLKALGYLVTIWIHPFVNIDCEADYAKGLEAGYFVKSHNGSTYTHWWNGDAAVIDFTNPAAAQWFVQKLKKLQTETGLDSFKFDSGESAYSPQPPKYADAAADDYPDTFNRAYVKTVDEFGDMIEVRTATGVQDISPFVRMMDRRTTWNGPLGFDTLIPTLLQMNIVGYPFVLPDMIGGNTAEMNPLTEEMFVRWLQVNVFMPVLQFSLPPWNFSAETVEITKKCIDLHAKYAGKIYELMERAVKDGTPVNLPLWWIDPSDSNTYAIDSEFLLGEDILVAPVVEAGARARDIYIPKGQWRDENKAGAPIVQGPIMLHNYQADLSILPYFTKVN